MKIRSHLTILCMTILLSLTNTGEAQTPKTELLQHAEYLRMALLTKNRENWIRAKPNPVSQELVLKKYKEKKTANSYSDGFQLSQTQMRQNIGLIQKSSVTASSSLQKILARVTVYWADGPGTDPWSAKNISSTQTPLVNLHHAAVDPNIIPYGSKLILQYKGGRIAVQAVDTGGDVKNKTASKKLGKKPPEKQAPVIDLFFQKREDAMKYAETHPPFQWVEIIPPKN